MQLEIVVPAADTINGSKGNKESFVSRWSADVNHEWIIHCTMNALAFGLVGEFAYFIYPKLCGGISTCDGQVQAKGKN